MVVTKLCWLSDGGDYSGGGGYELVVVTYMVVMVK